MIEDKDIQVTPGASVESAGRRGMAPVDVPTGVKVTHIRTGLVAFCDHERSQLKNLNVCKAMIEAGLVAAGWLVRPNDKLTRDAGAQDL